MSGNSTTQNFIDVLPAWMITKTDILFSSKQMVGIAQGALDNTIPYLMERRQFKKTLWDFQVRLRDFFKGRVYFWVIVIDQYPHLVYLR